MLPYFQLTSIPIGPLRIQVWGFFVALGILAAILVGRREVRKRGLDQAIFTDLASWIVIGSMIGARLLHALAYEPASYLADPFRIFRVWEGGMSSFGGFLGAAAAAWLFVRRNKVPFAPYADIACYALPLGYGIGRIGCFLIHDHPGTLSHSIIAVKYPDGPRLDHGLLLSLTGFAIFAFFVIRNRRAGPREQDFLPLFMLIYGATRFFLDFFRAWDLSAADARYLFLTPAQYGSLIFIALAAAYFISGKRAFRGIF